MSRREVGELVRNCMRGQAWRDPTPSLRRKLSGPSHPTLASTAAFHGGAAYVHEALRRLTHDHAEDERQLAAAHRLGVGNHLRALSDLHMVAPLLGGPGSLGCS